MQRTVAHTGGLATGGSFPRASAPRRRARWGALARAAAPMLALALALAAPAGRADLFSVAGLTVDVEAESAEAARRKAVAIAAGRALDAMLRKLTREADAYKLPILEPQAVTELVRGYEVTNERRSELRYIGEFTFRFDAGGVRALLREAAIPYAETRSPPLLVLPVMEAGGGPVLWDSPNPWREAWQRLNWRDRLVQLLLPWGDLEDLTGISAMQALTGDGPRLDALAQRYGAAGVLVAVARAGPEGTSVEVRPRGAPVAAPARNTLPAGDADPWFGAAEWVAGEIERSWKLGNLLEYGESTALDAIAALKGREGWLALRRALAALRQVERVEVHALSAAQAALTLHYLGAEAALRAALAVRGFSLRPAPGGPARIVAAAAEDEAAPPENRAPALAPDDPVARALSVLPAPPEAEPPVVPAPSEAIPYERPPEPGGAAPPPQDAPPIIDDLAIE